MYLRPGVAAIFVMGILLGGLEAQPLKDDICRPKMNPAEAVCSRGEMREDKLHYTVYLSPTATEPHRAAFRDAMKVWNDQSEITQIVLREISAEAADLQFVPGTAESKHKNPRACAAYESLGSFIWYSDEQMGKAIKKRELAIRIYAHEIGHALNLNDLPEPRRGEQRTKRLMRQAERDDGCERVAVRVIADVTPEDARNARRCAYVARELPMCITERASKSGGR